MIDGEIRKAGEPHSAAFKCQQSLPHRILVVDDEPDLCYLNGKTLSDAGYHVDIAADGASAWDTLQMNNYDLIITDNTMPRMTGIQLIERMHAAGMIVPVIMVSGTLPKEELTQSPMLQPVATLPKPYSAVELLEIVKKVLGATIP